MRIISGSHKGRRINIPKKLKIRPTTDRAKEALFNILENRYFFKDKTVLDLFAGSGNISYEFASRGCKNVLSIDKNKLCTNNIENTAQKLKLNINPILFDAFDYVMNCKEQFDFIFADPPYNYNYYHNIKNTILKNNLVKKNGCLIIEHDKNTIFHDRNIDHRKYGTVHFSIISQ